MVSTTPFQFGFNTAARPFTEQSTTKNTQNQPHVVSMLLLCAGMAALLVLADHAIDAWAEGHLLMGRLALWVVAFGVLGITSVPFQSFSKTLTHWVNAMQAQRIESQMWAFAQRDPRVMAELHMAMTRHRSDA